MSFEERIKELGLRLPMPPKPVAAYVPAMLCDGHVYVSGQLPIVDGKLKYCGKVGSDVTQEQGYEAARICALNCLAAARSVIGSLDEVTKVIKVTGYVASAPGFNGQPQVINGASELLEKIFGNTGRHSRAAVGVSELPMNAPVEVEMILKVR
ncbi:MAG TPA: RidA family protein [Clostridia bacterium]|nr:RidA family protein [Clostridia bacterium]